MALLESVPNVSEGRDAGLVAAIGEAFCSAGAALVDVHRDPWHHRSVFTLLGEGAALADGLVAGLALARARIDLAGHEGAHPRVGVVDVVPLVALAPEDEAAADAAALPVAERAGAELGLPVFLYGAALGGPAARLLPRGRRRRAASTRRRRRASAGVRPGPGRRAKRSGARGIAHAARGVQRGARRTARGRAGGRGRGAGLVGRAARRAGARSAAGRRHASRSRRTWSTSEATAPHALVERIVAEAGRRGVAVGCGGARRPPPGGERRGGCGGGGRRPAARRRAADGRGARGGGAAPCGFRASSRTASSSGTSRRLASG